MLIIYIQILNHKTHKQFSLHTKQSKAFFMCPPVSCYFNCIKRMTLQLNVCISHLTEFVKLLNQHKIKHIISTSPPPFSERAVQEIKNMIHTRLEGLDLSKEKWMDLVYLGGGALRNLFGGFNRSRFLLLIVLFQNKQAH